MPRGITVTGTGRASAPRDLVVLDLGAESRRDNPSDAIASASYAAGNMRTALLDAGVAVEDLVTGGVTLTPVHDPWPKVVGYGAAIRIVAQVRDVEGAGRVLGRAVAAGSDAARVQSVTFSHERPDEVAAAARDAAWADAEAKAQRYAQLAGLRLGPVLSVEETGGSVVPRNAKMLRAAAGGAPAADVPLDAGEGTVTLSVTVRWALD